MSSTTWKVSDGRWGASANWTNGVPDSGVAAVIDSGEALASTPIAAAALSVSDADLLIDGATGTSTVSGNLTIGAAGLVGIDLLSGTGGATLDVDGSFTLANRGVFTVGNTSLTKPDVVFVAHSYTLAGTLELQGGATTLVTFEVFGAPTPGVSTGNLSLSGDAVLEFDGGFITSIADGAQISLSGANARISNGVASSSLNSALVDLSDVAGDLTLNDGAALAPLANLTVRRTGSLALSADADDGGDGENLVITGGLVNDGAITLGDGGSGAPVELDVEGAAGISAGAVSRVSLFGASSADSARLIVSNAAAGFGTSGLLVGDVSLAGFARIEFADGGFTTIAAGATLDISGTHAFVADIGQTSSNSALTTLANIAGDLSLTDGAGLDLGDKVVSTGAIDIDAGSRLSLSGGAAIAGLVTGDGTLEILGGAATLANGAVPNVALISISGGAKLTVAENMSDRENLSLGAAATLAISGGDQAMLTGTTTLAGKVIGAGGLVLAGGSTTFNSGAALSTAKWSMMGTGAIAMLAGALHYAGDFKQGAGTTLSLAGGPLVLTGVATFSGGTINGSQRLSVEGTTTVSKLTIGGTVVLVNAKTLKQSGGDLTIGDANQDAAALDNASTGTYDITDNSGLKRGAAAGSSIDNAGLFEKTGGSGISAVKVAIANSGSIVVSSGTLDFARAITGVGKATIKSSAKLEFDGSVASGESVDFSGGGGELILAKILSGTSQQFHAGIDGFKAGDTIDVGAPFGSGTSLHFVENGAGNQGTLTITDGSSHAALTLLGAFTRSDFHHAGDGHGGTDITYSG